MGYQNFISELEAATLAGVTVATLNRFYEAGYLQFESDSDGLRLVSKSEVQKLFGIQDSPLEKSTEISNIPLSQQIETIVESPGFSTNEQLKQEVTSASKIEPKSNGWEILEREIQKLKNVVNVQEELLKIKDSQISETAAEKEWLRKRIENLEQRLDRDQIILMNESNIIRELLAAKDRKRISPMRAALEWFGLVEPTPTSTPATSRMHTYEVHR
jgi:predicted RNase H-like nuclease (RuvC/YqgF family)